MSVVSIACSCFADDNHRSVKRGYVQCKKVSEAALAQNVMRNAPGKNLIKTTTVLTPRDPLKHNYNTVKQLNKTYALTILIIYWQGYSRKSKHMYLTFIVTTSV